MKTIRLEKYNATQYKAKDVPGSIVGDFVDYECKVYGPGGDLVLLYMRAPAKVLEIARYFCTKTKPDKVSRTQGLPQSSSVFGVMPRNPLREDYCRFSKKCTTEKAIFQYVLKYNQMVSDFYRKQLPEYHKAALAEARKNVDGDYRVVDTPWTNVNINLNQVIKYHKDSGNNKNDLSNVLIVSNGVKGGHLACPELGMTLHQGDGWMVFFKGQELLHGVTPCEFESRSSYRCSVVCYTMDLLKHCYPYSKELERLKAVKTRQASNRRDAHAYLRSYLARQKEKQAQANKRQKTGKGEK